MPDRIYNLELHENLTASGGSEWRLSLVTKTKTVYVGKYGVFTEPGKSPEEMLARVLYQISKSVGL